MKALIATVLAAGVAVAAASPAAAAGGCGPGFHPGPHGHRCFPNGRGYGPRPGLVAGNFYAGHGYWDGRRYWGHRDRWHGGWRYR